MYACGKPRLFSQRHFLTMLKSVICHQNLKSNHFKSFSRQNLSVSFRIHASACYTNFIVFRLNVTICCITLRTVLVYHGIPCFSGCSGLVVEYRTRNREVAGSTHTRSTASNLEQVDNLLCPQTNSASYPQPDGKCVAATAMG